MGQSETTKIEALYYGVALCHRACFIGLRKLGFSWIFVFPMPSLTINSLFLQSDAFSFRGAKNSLFTFFMKELVRVAASVTEPASVAINMPVLTRSEPSNGLGG